MAVASQVNVQTVRFYERKGMLEEAERTPGRFRIYTDDAVGRIRFIRNAQTIGYSLDEIRELFELKVSEENPCDRVRELTQAKISEVDKKIRSMTKLKQGLERMLALCDEGGPTGQCPILDVLNQET